MLAAAQPNVVSSLIQLPSPARRQHSSKWRSDKSAFDRLDVTSFDDAHQGICVAQSQLVQSIINQRWYDENNIQERWVERVWWELFNLFCATRLLCLPFFTTVKVTLISVITSRHVGWRLCSTSRNDQLFLICHMPRDWSALFSTTHWCLHSDVKSSSGALIVVVQNALFISTSHCHGESESRMCSKQNYDHFVWVTTREDLSKQIKVSILNYPLRRNVKLINISARWNPDSPGNGNESERKINWFE